MFKDMKYLMPGVSSLFPNDSQADAIRKMERIQDLVRERVVELAILVSTTRNAARNCNPASRQDTPYPGAVQQATGLEGFSSTMLDIIDAYADPRAMHIEVELNDEAGKSF